MKAMTYISLLRGVNVSGKNLIRMPELSALYEGLDFVKVKTYIQSGNVIFETTEKPDNNFEEIIRAQIEKVFQFDIQVQVFTLEGFKIFAENNPFPKEHDKDTKFMHFTFIKDARTLPDQKVLENYLMPGEAFLVQPGVIYLYCPGGYGNTKLNNTFLEKKFQGRCTTRNFNTVHKLISIAEEVPQNLK